MAPEKAAGLKKLWRISNHSDLKGMGGERTSGRWHTAEHGKRIVYLSEHPALALVETLANLRGSPMLFPDQYQLLQVSVATGVPVGELPAHALSAGWEQDAPHTRAQGDAWLRAAKSPLLRVPSATAPESANYLLNPLHPEASRVTIAWSRWVSYDKRLFHLDHLNRR